MTFLCWLLMWFETILGLRVNMDKSKLIPLGSVKNAEDLASEIVCKVGNLPSTYLGGDAIGCSFQVYGSLGWS